MPRAEDCSPYGLCVGILIGIFIGREDCPEPQQEHAKVFQAMYNDMTILPQATNIYYTLQSKSGTVPSSRVLARFCVRHLAALPRYERLHDLRSEHQSDYEHDWSVDSTEWEGLQQPLEAAPSPLDYRIMSSVVAQQLHAIERAEDKTLDELQHEIREAFSFSDFGRRVADRVRQRLTFVRSLDDMVDLAAHFSALLRPPPRNKRRAHGRDRPMFLRPNSLFGMFLRRVRAACDGARFARLARLYEAVLRYTGRARDNEAVEDAALNIAAFPRGEDSFARSPGAAAVDAHSFSFSEEVTGAGNPPHLSGSRVVGVWHERDGSPSFAPSVPAWQLQRRLQTDVLRLTNGLSSQVPFEEIEGEVQVALHAHSDMPKAHFLRLMNCLQHRELQGSLDSLHRYFDYAVRRGGPSASTAENFLDLAKGSKGGSGRHSPQHASLALARLHFEFGHLELASLALGEAIRVAQQSGDKACVAQSMGWLHQVLAAQGHPRAGDVLRRCASQAADLGLHHLVFSTALLLAKEAAEAQNGSLSLLSPASTAATSVPQGGWRGGHASPIRVWECLAAAASGDVRGLLDREVQGGGGFMEGFSATSGGAVRPAVDKVGGRGGEMAGARECQRLLVEAKAFERFGCSDMVVTCARSVLQVHGSFATASDVELACAAVMAAVLGGKRFPGMEEVPRLHPDAAGSPLGVSDPEGATERSRAATTHGTDSTVGAGGECVYATALAMALRQHKVYPYPVSNVWAAGVMVLLHEWMINRGELTAAEGLGMSLRGCCPLRCGAEAFVEAHLQKVKLLRAQGRYAAAIDAASKLANFCDTRGLAPQYALLLLEMSRVRLEAEPASPVGALPHALRSLAVCESYSLYTIHASAMTHLGDIHLRMGSSRRARLFLRACLGQLLANATTQSQGEAWLAMAKCDIAEASLGPLQDEAGGGHGDGERQGSITDGRGGVDDLRRAILHLDRAITMLKKCHDFTELRECWYLKARVWGELGARVAALADEAKLERNIAARAFLTLTEATARALAVPSPGLRIGPQEVERYTLQAMASVPWAEES